MGKVRPGLLQKLVARIAEHRTKGIVDLEPLRLRTCGSHADGGLFEVGPKVAFAHLKRGLRPAPLIILIHRVERERHGTRHVLEDGHRVLVESVFLTMVDGKDRKRASASDYRKRSGRLEPKGGCTRPPGCHHRAIVKIADDYRPLFAVGSAAWSAALRDITGRGHAQVFDVVKARAVVCDHLDRLVVFHDADPGHGHTPEVHGSLTGQGK